MAMVSSPGMFHASASFLPSSFAMFTAMLGMAAFMNWRGGLKTTQAITWFAIGGIIGWPFAMALSAPFLFEEILFASMSSKEAFIDAIMRLFRGLVASLLVLVSLVQSRLEHHLTPTDLRIPDLWLSLQTEGFGAAQHRFI